MQPVILRTTGVQNSNAVVLDYYGWPNITFQAVVAVPATYTVEVTLDNPMLVPAASIAWFPHPAVALANASANQLVATQDFFLGVRLRQTAGAGSVALTIIQVGRNT